MLTPRSFAPLATSIAALLIATSAPAANLNWDADGNPGAPIGGSGTWSVTGQNWTDGGIPQPWVNSANNIAVFGGGSSGTVTLEVPFNVGGLIFDTAGYVLTGQSLNFGAVGENTIAVNANATINSVLTGESTAEVKISGPGTLTLTGMNTYAGPTSIVGSTVVVNDFGDAAGGNLGTTGRISLAEGVLRYTGPSTSTTRTFAMGVNGFTGGGTLEITQADTTFSFAGALTHVNAQSLTKTGAGTLVLEGAGDNSGGRVILDAGKLVLGKTSSSTVHSLGSNGNGDYALVINNGTVQLAGTGDDQIYYRSAVQINGGTFDMNGKNEGFAQLEGNGGTVTNSAAGTISRLTLGEDNGSAAFGGVLTDGAGVLALTKTGTGTLTISGANNYSGGTIVDGGTLFATTRASLPGYEAAGNIVVNSGGTLAVRVGGAGEWQTADLQVLRSSAIFNAGSGFALDTTSGDFTFGESLSGGLSFTKLGENTLLLTGANAHTGGATVTAGTLKLGSPSAFGTGPGTVNGGTLDLNGVSITTSMLNVTVGEVTNSSTTDATITINLGADVAGNNAGLLSTTSTGKLHLVINATAGGSASNYGLSSANTFVGSVTVNGVGNTAGTRGVLGVTQSGGLGDSSNVLTLNDGGTLANMSNPTTTGSWPTYGSPVLDNPIVLTGSAGGVLRAGYGPAGMTLNGVISGPGNLTKTDGGYVELTAENTYQGSTTIAGGTLSLGNGGTTGSIPSTSQVIFGSGTGNRLAFNRQGTTVFPNAIDKGGRANLSIGADQTVELTGSISGTGEFWISGPGTLIARPNANTAGSGSIVLNNGATLEISDFSTQTFGSGNFFLSQGGTDSTLRYTGSSVSTGRLTGAVFQGASSTLEVTNPETTLTLAAALTAHGNGFGPTIKEGLGTLALAGANTYTGGTTVAKGTLLVNNTSGSGTGTGALNVLANGILGGTGTIAPTGFNGISSEGVIAPGLNNGNRIGSLTINLGGTDGTMSLTNTGSFRFELGTAGTMDIPGTSDRLIVLGASAGDVAFANNIIDLGATGEVGWYRLFSTSLDETTWTGLSVNQFNVITGGLSVTNLPAGFTGELVMGDGSLGADGHIYLHVVPEPGSTALLLGAAGALLGFRRRRAGVRA